MKWPVIVGCLGIALSLGSPLSLADSGKGKGHGNDKGHSQDARGAAGGGDNWSGAPHINTSDVLGVLGNHRDYWSPAASLPPGIQKKLARGKPLPPGIAKKLDNRLLAQLPRYSGYEWQQAGTDLILVAIATGLVYEVLNGAFD